MVNRDRGNGMPLFLFGKDNPRKVYEFCSSTFNREHLKYSRLMSFMHEKKEYKVGDFITTHDDDEHVYQIQAIGYTKNKTLHPDLRFMALVFINARVFYENNPSIRKPSRTKSNEYIKLEDRLKLKPADIEELVDLVTFEENKSNARTCRYAFADDIFYEYRPMKVNFCDEFIENGTFPVPIM